MSNILSSFFKKANLNIDAVKEFIDNGTTETVSRNTATGQTTTEPSGSNEDQGLNTKPALIIQAVSSNNIDAKINVPIKRKKVQAQVSLAYSSTSGGRQLDRFARSLFTPVEKDLSRNEYFSENLEKLNSLKDDEGLLAKFDSWVGLYNFGPLNKVQNCFTVKELLAFESRMSTKTLGDLRKIGKEFLDNLQTSPNITKIIKPYSSGSVKGYMLLETFESAKDAFVISEIKTDSAGKTQLCIVSSRKAIDMSNLFTPQGLQDFAEVTGTGYASFYIHNKKMRFQFIYALLKAMLARNLDPFDLEIETGRTKFNTQMNNFLEGVVQANFSNSKDTFVRYMLGLYRFCSNYQSFSEYVANPEIKKTEGTAVPESKVAKDLNHSSFELLNTSDQIETSVSGAFLSQTYADAINLPYVYFFGKYYSILSETKIKGNEVLFEDIQLEYEMEDLQEYYFNLFLLQNLFVSYLKTGLVSRLSRGALNFFELPKRFENCLGFVCGDRICRLKGDFDKGLWGFISPQISSLALYNQRSKSPKKINKKLFVRGNGEVFSNDMLTVIDTSVNKISVDTASKIITIQQDFLAAFQKYQKSQKTYKMTAEGLTKAFSYGCGLIPSEQVSRLERISHLVGQTTQNYLTLEIDPKTNKISLKTANQESLEILRADSTFLTFRPKEKITFQITSEILPLLETLAETHEKGTDFFVNIVECRLQTSTKTKIEEQLEGFDNMKQALGDLNYHLASNSEILTQDRPAPETVFWSIASNLDQLSSTKKIETLTFKDFIEAMKGMGNLKSEKQRNIESKALTLKNSSLKALGQNDPLLWLLSLYSERILDEDFGGDSKKTTRLGELLNGLEAFEFFNTPAERDFRITGLTTTQNQTPKTLQKYVQCMLITSTQGITVVPLQNMQQIATYSFDSTYDKNLAEDIVRRTNTLLKSSIRNEPLSDKVASSFSGPNFSEYKRNVTESAPGVSGLMFSKMHKEVKIVNSFSPICPYRLVYQIREKPLSTAETLFERLLTREELQEVLKNVEDIEVTGGKNIDSTKYYDLPNFVETFEKSQKIRSHFERSLGFILFRDVWSSGYTLKGLMEKNALKFDTQTRHVLTENRDFLEGLYSKRAVAFNRANLEYSIFVAPLVNNQRYSILQHQKVLMNAYSNVKDPDRDVSFEKYLAENQKEFCYYPDAIFKYYEESVLEEEIRKYFPEYFASISSDPINPPFQMDLANYPENATTPDKFHEKLVELLLSAQYDFVQKPDVKNFYEIKKVTISVDGLAKIVEAYPNFCSSSGFAGYILNSLLPVIKKSEGDIDRKEENKSPFRFRIYLRADISSGWINADLAVSKGINLMPQANSFHIVELMSPVSFISKNTQEPTKIPFWQAIVEHYENQGVQVAFVQATETTVRSSAEEKMQISVTSAFPPNFFLLNREKFYGEDSTTKWYEDKKNFGWRTTISIDDPFLIETGFYYYLGAYNPIQGGAVSLEHLSDINVLNDDHRKMISDILTAMLDLASDIERRDALAAQTKNQGSSSSFQKELEARFANADLGYVKLVNWWIDLLPDDREYFFNEYIQPRGRLSLRKIKIPQHFNSLLPKDEMPIAMQNHPNSKDFELYPYQKQAVNAALNQKRILFNMEMGLGKTITAITTFFKLRENPKSGIDRMLIIVPKTPQKSWMDEMRDRVQNGLSLCDAMIKVTGTKAFAAMELLDDFKKGKKPVLIFNEHEMRYDPNFANSEKVFWKLVEVLTEVGASTLLVVDELHEFKNPDSFQSKGLSYISKLCDRVIGMTGTLKPNTVIDYYTCVEIVAPGTFGMSADGFVDTFCLTGLKGKMKESTFNPLKLEDFYRVSAPFVFTRVIDSTSQSSNLESVYIPLKPANALTPHIPDALDPIQSFLMSAMEMIIAVHQKFKSRKSDSIKEIKKNIAETRTNLSSKKAEIKKLEKTIRELPADNLTDLKRLRAAQKTLTEELAFEEGKLDTQTKDLNEEMDQDPFSKFKRMLLEDSVDAAGIQKELSKDGESGLPSLVAVCTVSETIWKGANPGRDNFVPEFYKLAAIANPEGGGFNDLHEQLILSPRVFVNARIVKLQKRDQDEKTELVKKYDLKATWDQIIPQNYVSRKTRYIANAVLRELEDNPHLNCLVFGWYIESIKDLQKLLQESKLPNSQKVLGEDAVEIIYGETPFAKRPDILNGFNGVFEKEDGTKTKDYNKIRVLIAQLNTVSTGVNLQKKCKFVAFLTTPWEPQLLTQGQARVWRNGQKNTVSILRPTCTDLDQLKEQTLKAKIIGASQSSGTSGAGDQSITQGLTNVSKGGLDTQAVSEVHSIEEILGLDEYVDIRVQAADCDIPEPLQNVSHEQQQFAYYDIANPADLPSRITDLEFVFCRFGIDRNLTKSDPTDVNRILSDAFKTELRKIGTSEISVLEAEIKKALDAASAIPVKQKLLVQASMKGGLEVGKYKPKNALDSYRLCERYVAASKHILTNVVSFDANGSLVIQNFDSSYRGFKVDGKNVALKENLEARRTFYKLLAEYMIFANAMYRFGAFMYNAVVHIKNAEAEVLEEVKARGALRSLTKLMRNAPQTAAETISETVNIFPYRDFVAIHNLKYKTVFDSFAGTMSEGNLVPLLEDQLGKYMNRQEFNFISKPLQNLLIEAALDRNFIKTDIGRVHQKLDWAEKFSTDPDYLEPSLFAPSLSRIFLGDAMSGTTLVANNITAAEDFRMLMSPLFLYLLAIQRVYTDTLLDMIMSEIRYEDNFYDEATRIANKSHEDREKFKEVLAKGSGLFKISTTPLEGKSSSEIGARILMRMSLEYPENPTGILKALADLKNAKTSSPSSDRDPKEVVPEEEASTVKECEELKDLLRIDVFAGKGSLRLSLPPTRKGVKEAAFRDKLTEFVNKIATGTKDNLFWQVEKSEKMEVFATSHSFKTLLSAISDVIYVRKIKDTNAYERDHTIAKTQYLLPVLVPTSIALFRRIPNEAFNTQFVPVPVRAPFIDSGDTGYSQSRPRWNSTASELRTLNPLLLEATTTQEKLKKLFLEGVQIQISPAISMAADNETVQTDNVITELYGTGTKIKRWTLPDKKEIFREFQPFKVLTYFNALSTCVSKIFVLKSEILALGRKLDSVLSIHISVEDIIYVYPKVAKETPDLKVLEIAETLEKDQAPIKGPRETDAYALFTAISSMRRSSVNASTPDPDFLARNYSELLACVGEFSAYCNLRNVFCDILKDGVDVEATSEITSLNELAEEIVKSIYSDNILTAGSDLFKEIPITYTDKIKRVQELQEFQKQWKRAGATLDILEKMLLKLAKSIDKTKKQNQHYLVTLVQTKCTEKGMQLQIMDSLATKTVQKIMQVT